MNDPLKHPRSCDPAIAHANEFAPGATDWSDRFSRRDFLALAGATVALAGIEGCSGRPAQNIVPYVKQPEQLVPGEPLFFTSAHVRGGYARGVIVTSREGRPIKIEGNPDHPASLGAADAQMQAEIFSLYDPQRSKTVKRAGAPETWGNFVEILDRRLSTANDGGAGLRILTGVIGSPTTKSQLDLLLKKYPKARVHEYDPLGRYNTPRNQTPVYHFDKADVIVSLDADFLWNSGSAIVDAKRFIDGRRVRNGTKKMNRLYVIESTYSITGSMADHRLAVRPEQVDSYLQNVRQLVDSKPADLRPAIDDLSQQAEATFEKTTITSANGKSVYDAEFLLALVDDLHSRRGRCLVLAGESQPRSVHAAVADLNRTLGNVGTTVEYITPPIISLPDAGPASLAALTADLNAGNVSTLLIHADDPTMTCPGDIAFADALKKFSVERNADGTAKNFSAHLAPYYNRTSYLCQWHINAAHSLESWSDAIAFDGTGSIVQPLIDPLYNGKTDAQFLAAARGDGGADSYTLVRAAQQALHRGVAADFENDWNDELRTGVIRSSAQRLPPSTKPATFATAAEPLDRETTAQTTSSGAISLRFCVDHSALDGRSSMNAWLQELPRPLTKLVWSNAAIVSPEFAIKQNLEDNDLIEISRGGKTIQIPTLILRGHPDETITLHIGYGQLAAVPEISGDRGPGAEPTRFVGVDVNPLRSSENEWFATDAFIRKLDKKLKLVTTRSHSAMAEAETAEERKLVRHGKLSTFVDSPEAIVEKKKSLLTLYPGKPWEDDYAKGPQWAMAIDQSACIGCNACVIACQSENNIPVVGPDQVAAQREMHWLRIDSYFTDDGVQHQPVPCMHCENAPCEYVCPVEATTHSPDGINEMTYNRCVGTRYCSNNCPYKVRRFNFLYHTLPMADSLQLAQNPNVTVRTKGVMEKCTYCVQRLNYTKRKVEIASLDLLEQARVATDQAEKDRLNAEARKLEREMTDKVQTACQQTCPTQAIIFGDQNDRSGSVADLQSQKLNYTLLDELTTKPRTSYLAKVWNPNTAVKGDHA